MTLSILFILPITLGILWATQHYLDNHLLNREDSGGEMGHPVGGLFLFSVFFGVFALITSFIISRNSILESFSNSPKFVFLLFISGILYALWIGFYLFSLKDEDPMTVVPYLQTLPIFIFIIDFFAFSSIPTMGEITGSSVIVLGALVLSFDTKTLKLKTKVVFLMLAGVFLFAISGTIFDQAETFLNMGYWMAIFWQYTGVIFTGTVLLILVPSFRKQFLNIFTQKHKRGKILLLNAANETLETISQLILFFAFVVGQNTLVSSIAGATEPVMVFFTGYIIFVGLKIRNKFSKNDTKKINYKDFINHSISQVLISLILLAIGFLIIILSDNQIISDIKELLNI